MSPQDLDADGDADLVVGTWTGAVVYYRNDGLKAGVPQFTRVAATHRSNPLRGLEVGGKFAGPTFVDIDQDGDMVG
jgi:hypothetical protein